MTKKRIKPATTKKMPNAALRAVREQTGMSQARLAETTGTSQQDIARIEAGREPRVGMAILIARALDADVEAIFEAKKVEG